MSISVFIGSTILRDPSSECLESLRTFCEILIFGQISWNTAFYLVKTEFWESGTSGPRSFWVKTTSGMFPRPVPTSDTQPFVRHDFLELIRPWVPVRADIPPIPANDGLSDIHSLCVNHKMFRGSLGGRDTDPTYGSTLRQCMAMSRLPDLEKREDEVHRVPD